MSTTSSASLDVRRFLLALIADLAADRKCQPCFKAAHRQLHVFFWQLRQSERTRPFVEDLMFDTNGSYPQSEQIDDFLQELQLSGILSRPNPTYRYNNIAITSTPAGDEFKRALRPDQRAAYDEVLAAFKAQLGVPAAE